MNALQIISLHSILSYDMCFGPHVIMSRYALTIKQTTRNDFQKQLDIQKLIEMIKPFV